MFTTDFDLTLLVVRRHPRLTQQHSFTLLVARRHQ
ncbi:hypothetical protein BVRB_5g126240 [Beta vulgaris subsp. vulgaris]|uniref:Uncharacterized protein n=1 Tax=Beta vulgaris subsp. vulgaris TaxID=3555 RepID=A0A0J8B8D5_BETVV|nr:hypothetical protein BVRB_5g126240 [Beta vulgaris subsp. vulgaris]